MLSMKAKYGLRALLYLARQQNQEEPVLISELAEKEKIPKKFLELILLDLKNHGLLQSKKGKGGGYLLSRRPEAIKLGRVVRVLDGPIAPLPCASQTAYIPCDECEDEKTCGIRLVMKDVRDATAKILDGTSLADVLRRVEEASTQPAEALTYHI
ncbi:MAG: transcriptional regulator [Acidobacteria bacterium]|nr:MAG: transcriptional regulator [Acidobacteriota bacterium]